VAARRLPSRLDAGTGEQIRRRSLDTTSAGNARQRELREVADDEGYAEPNLWTGIGRAPIRSVTLTSRTAPEACSMAPMSSLQPARWRR
jgi:hypothetical protein